MKRFWLCCLLLLLLALPALCQAEGTPVSLNDMIKTDSERIELCFLDSKNNAKTDATLLLCYGKERLEVLVVDGGGSVRRALVGGNLAAAAERNGWAGIVVHGCVRDAAELREAKVGIAALGLMPMPTEKRGQGQQNVVLDIAGARVAPGDWLYADEDGIVLSSTAIHQA